MLKNLPELPGSIGSSARKLPPFGGYPYPSASSIKFQQNKELRNKRRYLWF
jgi:hypothetical protein